MLQSREVSGVSRVGENLESIWVTSMEETFVYSTRNLREGTFSDEP
jgi:hypothetical protein